MGTQGHLRDDNITGRVAEKFKPTELPRHETDMVTRLWIPFRFT